MSEESEYQLYGAFGDRYDLHTPPQHYIHDHTFVIERARARPGEGKLLDLGCGTGVLLEKALAAGLEPYGIDSAPNMLALAKARVGAQRVELASMQSIDVKEAFDCVVSLSWSLNYCQTVQELHAVLHRAHQALRPGGGLILQVAHAPHAPLEAPTWSVDREFGPGGPDDIVLSYRFWASEPQVLMAQYRFECISRGDGFEETHTLRIADARLVARFVSELGFEEVELLESWRAEPFDRSLSPFIVARRAP